MGGYLFKPTKTNTILNIDVSNLSLYSQTDFTTNNLMKNGIALLRASTDTDASYTLGMSWFDASNVFLKNYSDASGSLYNQVVTTDVLIKGNIKATDTHDSVGIGSGALVINGGSGIGGNLSIGGNVTINSFRDCSGYNIGALVVNGGVGVGGNIFIKGNSSFIGNIAIANNFDSTSSNSGALVVNGGFAVGGSGYIHGNLNIESTQEATNPSILTSGAFIVNGGACFGGNVYLGGNLAVKFTTESLGVNSGALVVAGGAGFSGNLNVKGNTNIYGANTNITSNVFIMCSKIGRAHV